jgi:DNA-binding GntR family transcriptional regulator
MVTPEARGLVKRHQGSGCYVKDIEKGRDEKMQ